jgi:CheY-like chemotaxis protein
VKGEGLATQRAGEQSRLSGFAADFLARITHGIRSPLNIILGYNELLANRLAQLGDDTQRPYLEGIRRSGAQILDAIDKVHDYARIAEGAIDLTPVRIELAPFLATLVQDYRVIAAPKGLQVICEIIEPQASIRCDLFCLTRAISNLLDNAIKFTHKGGVIVRLFYDTGHRICIQIQDTGVGFEDGVLEWARDPFSVDDRSQRSRYEPSGALGIMLAHACLNQIHSELSFSSEAGKGATVNIHFAPELEDRTLPDKAPARQREGVSTSGGGLEASLVEGLPTILIVEDQEDQAFYLQAILRQKFEPVVATTSEAALQCFNEIGDKIKLVLMDLGLPGGSDGFGLTRSLRGNTKWKAVPIIAISAYAFDEDRALAMSAGCSAYLAKPVTSQVLLATITRLIG